MINEQTGAHTDAADNYEKAWKYSRKNQPTIGKISNMIDTLNFHRARSMTIQ